MTKEINPVTYKTNSTPSATPAVGEVSAWVTSAGAWSIKLHDTTVLVMATTADLAGKQPLDATLTALAGLTVAANKGIYATGSDAFSPYDLTSYGRTLGGLADAAALKSNLSLNNVENTALSTWTGSTNITTLGTIATAVIPQSVVTSLVSDLALKAPLASPTFTGTPVAPTASPGTNTTQISTTAFVQAAIALAVTGVLELQGNLDCSGNPNYPSASKGDLYYASVAGKVGGASGQTVEIGDAIIAKADNAGGTEASVGSSWFILQKNLVGALLSANNLSDLASASTARTNLGLGSVENTALSTWAGTTNIVTLGTVTSGTWHGTAIGAAYLPKLNGLTAPDGNVDFGGYEATNLAEPTTDSSAATKAYVDSGGSGVSKKSVILTHSQILDLDSTPVTVVPAPGEGKLIAVVSATFASNITTPYEDGDQIQLHYGASDATGVWAPANTLYGSRRWIGPADFSSIETREDEETDNVALTVSARESVDLELWDLQHEQELFREVFGKNLLVTLKGRR